MCTGSVNSNSVVPPPTSPARFYVTLILTHCAVFILPHSVASRKFRLESKSDPSTAIANTSVEPSRTWDIHPSKKRRTEPLETATLNVGALLLHSGERPIDGRCNRRAFDSSVATMQDDNASY